MSRFPDAHQAAQPLGCFALTALAIGVAWWWLGNPVALPPSPLAAGEKLYCVSYAPFRDAQNPLIEGTVVPPGQIDEDMALLSHYTDCVRTYSVDDVLDRVLIDARKYGMKVLQGIWVSNNAAKTQQQIATTVEYAKKFPEVIRAIIVGNEVLLRGEMSPTDLEAIIRQVKSQVSEPVTYADVWEFWLRYADLRSVVDFVTVHILPYWEDFPIPASEAAAHVDAIRKRVAGAIPDKDILIGEFGWPSHGRMREGALPSPANQGRVIEETLALAKRENYRVNVIEAFDQPWKRLLEGSTGGYWGVVDRTTGEPKFTLGGAVSDHPHWLWQAIIGIALAALTFSGAWLAGGGRKSHVPGLWPRVAVLAFFASVMFGWTVELIPLQSYSAGGWLRSIALGAVAAIAPILCAAATSAGRSVPPFAALLSRHDEPCDWFGIALAGVFLVLVVLAVEEALGLVFDPRYRDFVFAPLSAAIIPFLTLMLSTPRQRGVRAIAETVSAGVLTLCAIYILPNETLANWQSAWFCAAILALAVVLERTRDLPSPG